MLCLWLYFYRGCSGESGHPYCRSSIVNSSKASSYPSNNLGIQFVNGVFAILNYSKDCEWLNPLEAGGANRTNAAQCLSIIYDVNGAKKPNKVGKDVVLLNAELSRCDMKVLGRCYKAPTNDWSALTYSV